MREDASVVAVIADFGIARVTSFEQTGGAMGTVGYMAPEIIMHMPYSPMADASLTSLSRSYRQDI